MILGLRSVVYPVSDLPKATAWYTRVLEIEPYFNEPFYVGYAVGGFELGLAAEGTPGRGGAIAYWGVTDVAAALARLVSLGATVNESLQDIGDGIRYASVVDPFGNTLGVVENPFFSRYAVR